MAKISIIIPVYKVEQYLPECLDSVINQTYKNLEIICVDDGSPDNSGKILDEYASKDNRIKVIHKENGGVSSARNAGLDIATGDWISFVDADDYIASDFYDKLIGSSKDGEADVVQCGYTTFGGDFNRTVIWDEMETRLFAEMIQGLKRGFTCNKLWKSKLIQENNLRFINDIYLEDVPFSLIACHYANKFVRIPYAGYFYRSNPSSITNNKDNKSKIKEDTYAICEKVVEFYKDIDLTKEERDTLYRVVFLFTHSPSDLLNKAIYSRCIVIFGSNKILKKYRKKAIMEWIFKLSFSRRKIVLFGKTINF